MQDAFIMQNGQIKCNAMQEIAHWSPCSVSISNQAICVVTKNILDKKDWYIW